MLVTNVVVRVILVIATSSHTETVAVAETVLAPFTVIVPVAFTVPHPPVRGIE